MLGVEVDKVYHTNNFLLTILNHHTQLSVDIDIVFCVSNVIM